MQLVVNAEHAGGHLVEALENLVHAEVHNGANAVHDHRGNAHLQNGGDDLPVGLHKLHTELHLGIVAQIQVDAQHRAGALADDRRHGGTGHAHLGHAPPAVDEHGVENDVDDGAGTLEDHGLHGPAGGLEQPLAEDLDENANGEDAADAGIGNAALNGFRHGGLHGVVGPDTEEAEEHKQRRSYQRQKYALARSPVDALLILPAQALAQQRIDAHANTHGKADLHILHRECQRKRRDRTLGHLGHIHTVHNIIKRLDQHGNDHRQGHIYQQLSHRHNAHFVLLQRLFLHNVLLSILSDSS